jgi:hypothetical protein
MKAIQPIVIINPSHAQKIRKFHDRDVTQICDSQVPPASPPTPRWLRHQHASKAHDARFQIAMGSGLPKRRRSGGDELAKMPRSGWLAPRRGQLAAGPAAQWAWPPPAFFGPRRLRVKKSLPDRGGCSMINNLPKLMGESAARGRFQDENFKLLSVAHGDMEYRNILPLGRITAVIHSRNGGGSLVLTGRLRKAAIPVNCWSLRTNSSIKKQSRAVYRGE